MAGAEARSFCVLWWPHQSRALVTKPPAMGLLSATNAVLSCLFASKRHGAFALPLDMDAVERLRCFDVC